MIIDCGEYCENSATLTPSRQKQIMIIQIMILELFNFWLQIYSKNKVTPEHPKAFFQRLQRQLPITVGVHHIKVGIYLIANIAVPENRREGGFA